MPDDYTILRSILLADDSRYLLAKLRHAGELQRLLPEVDALFGVPQPAQHHPEVCTGLHTLLVVEQAARLTPAYPADIAFAIRLAALLHDVGKALTPVERLPSHPGHERAGVVPAKRALERLAVSPAIRNLVLAVVEFHHLPHQASILTPGRVVKLLDNDLANLTTEAETDAFLLVCEADARGRLGLEERPYPEQAMMRRAFDCIRKAPTDPRPGVATQLKVAAAAEGLRAA